MSSSMTKEGETLKTVVARKKMPFLRTQMYVTPSTMKTGEPLACSTIMRRNVSDASLGTSPR